jgi:Uma2 family endonuclease
MSVPALRRWTVAEYHRAAESGVFAPEERLELIEGEIYRMSPQGSPHSATTGSSGDLLREAFGKGFIVRVQMPLTLDDDSEPEPDLAVVRGTWTEFADEHPHTAELVVETSESSSSYDLGLKARVYARAAVPEYWVLLTKPRIMVVHRDPDPAAGSYRTIIRVDAEQTVSPLGAARTELRVADLFPAGRKR